MNDINFLAETLRIARIAYQVQITGEPYIVDPDDVTAEILFPDQWDDSTQTRVDGWTIILGEGDRKVRGVGATLADAAAALRGAVDARAAKVREMLREGGP
jgi:hypothetical protein